MEIVSLMDKLQELTVKLECASTLEEIVKYDNEIGYIRNRILELTK